MSGDSGDRVAAKNFMDGMGISSHSIPPDIMKRIGDDMIAGYGGFPLIGTKEQVVDQLRMLAENGVDGILLTWPAFITGMERFQREVLPLLGRTHLSIAMDTIGFGHSAPAPDHSIETYADVAIEFARAAHFQQSGDAASMLGRHGVQTRPS